MQKNTSAYDWRHVLGHSLFKPEPGQEFRCIECRLLMTWLSGDGAWTRCFRCAGRLVWVPKRSRHPVRPRSFEPRVHRGGLVQIPIRTSARASTALQGSI